MAANNLWHIYLVLFNSQTHYVIYGIVLILYLQLIVSDRNVAQLRTFLDKHDAVKQKFFSLITLDVVRKLGILDNVNVMGVSDQTNAMIEIP